MKKKRIFILSICAALLVVGILVAIFRSKRPALYRVTYLPSLGGQFTFPCSINDRGQIVGFSAIKRRTYHLFLWDREKGMQDLGPVVNMSLIYINNSGQIAATMRDPNRYERAFVWDPDQGRRILPTLGGKRANAYGINNHGQVVGAAETALDVFHAFAWDDVNGIRDLTPSNTTGTRAMSINDAGQVIVSAQSNKLLVSANKDTTSEYSPIPVSGLTEINSSGYVIGTVLAGPSKFDISLWHPDSGMKKLLQLNAGSPGSLKINDVNQVVFSERRQDTTLFGRTLLSTAAKSYLQDPNLGRISLNEYVSIGRNENLWLTDINNNGCIIGTIHSTKDSRSRGVLLEPIPEKWNK